MVGFFGNACKKTFLRLGVLCIFLVLTRFYHSGGGLYAQNAFINATGIAPDPSAMLDLDVSGFAANNKKGLLIPRMTSAQRNAIPSPAAGLLIFNISTNLINFYNGSFWRTFNDAFSSSTVAGGTGTGTGAFINNTGNAPDPSAILDVQSTSHGLLPPRTIPGSVISPVAGLVIYSTGTNRISFFDGSVWQSPCDEGSDLASGGIQAISGAFINTSGSSPHQSALLDIGSTGKGLLLPRITSTDRDNLPSPANGLIIYNSTVNKMEFFNGIDWRMIMNTVPPVPGIITGTTPVCSSQSGVSFSISSVFGATGYVWSVPAGSTITSGQGTTSITVTFGVTSGDVSVSSTNACGSSASSTFATTVNLSSVDPTGATATVNPTCGGATTLSQTGGTLGTGASWNWYTSSCGGTFVGAGTPSVSPVSTTTYYVRAEGTCNNTSCASVAVTVTTIPTAVSVITAGTYCDGTTLTASGGTGGTIYWQNTTSGGTSTSTPSSSQAVGATGTYYFRANNTCGWSTEGSAAVTINVSSVAPTGATASTNPTCGGATTLTATGGSLGTGASWNWYTSGCGGTFVGSGTPSVSPGSTTTYYVRAEGTCNNTSCASVAVTVNSVPTAVSVITAGTYCSGGTTLTASGGSGGTIYWQGTTSGGTSTATPSSSQSVASTGTYYFRANNSCGWGTEGSAAVTVLSAVNYGTLTAGDATICNNTTAAGADPAVINFSTLPSGSGSFTYQWYYQNGLPSCPATNDAVGSWLSIGGATGATYDPPSGLYTNRSYAVRVTPAGAPTCGTVKWATGCRKITVKTLTMDFAPSGTTVGRVYYMPAGCGSGLMVTTTDYYYVGLKYGTGADQNFGGVPANSTTDGRGTVSPGNTYILHNWNAGQVQAAEYCWNLSPGAGIWYLPCQNEWNQLCTNKAFWNPSNSTTYWASTGWSNLSCGGCTCGMVSNNFACTMTFSAVGACAAMGNALKTSSQTVRCIRAF